MNGIFFFVATLGFIFGIAIGSVFSFSFEILLGGVGFIIALLVTYIRTDDTRIVAVVLCVFCFLCGAARYGQAIAHFPHELDQYENTIVSARGMVALESDHREKSTLLTIEVTSIHGAPHTGTILVSHDRRSPVQYGDEVVVTGKLEAPAAFDTDLGRTFDYPQYLRALGVDHVMHFATVKVESHDNGYRVVAMLYSIKEHAVAAVNGALTSPAQGLALGLLLGEKQALGKELLDVFRIAGVIHIVVLSGYNISILIEALMRTLRFVLTPRARGAVGMVAVAAFVVMVGPSATVLRASAMAVLVLLAQITGRQYAIARALVATAAVMLLWNPFLLAHDPGFQLSFLATLGLVVVAPLYERWFTWVPNTFSIRGYVISTLATQTLVLPLLVYSVGLFSTVALFANLLILPFVPLAMLLSAIAGGMYLLIPMLGIVVGYPAYLLLMYIITVAETLSKIPYAGITVPPFSFIYLVLCYLFITFAIIFFTLDRTALTKVKLTQTDRDVFPFA